MLRDKRRVKLSEEGFYQFLVEHPGVTAKEAVRLTGTSLPTIRVRMRELTAKKRMRREQELTELEQRLYAVKEGEEAVDRICSYNDKLSLVEAVVKEHGELTSSEVAFYCKASAAMANKYLSDLVKKERLDIVRKEKRKNTRYFKIKETA